MKSSVVTMISLIAAEDLYKTFSVGQGMSISMLKGTTYLAITSVKSIVPMLELTQ